MIDRIVSAVTRLSVGWFAIGVVVSVAIITSVGYRAIMEWQHSAAQLAQQRADAAVDQLVTAINRDMHGVQTSVLSALRVDEAKPRLLLDLNDVGSAFARYPYAESFFSSGGSSGGADPITFYTRVERPPAWLRNSKERTLFPVVRTNDTAVSQLILHRLLRDVGEGRHFATFDTTLLGARYQVVALLNYSDATHEHLDSIVGFVVSIDWVRRNYFQEIVAQVLRMQRPDAGLTMTIVDGSNESIVAGVAGAEGPSNTRSFALLFFSPSLIALDPPSDLKREVWTARALVYDDRTLTVAKVGARRTLSIAAVSAFVLALGFTLAFYAIRANAGMTTMRSEFVSAVTHELKTPIATIRAACETLADGRRVNSEVSRDYARLAVQEAKRLTRLIDNLLAYARMTDLTEAYSFEPLDVQALAQQTLKEFSSQLSTGHFAVSVQMPVDLPAVRGDRPSMSLALANVVDNAIRYSKDMRVLKLAAHTSNGSVVLDVTDAGVGIPADEIRQVTHRFFRGSGAVGGGSGLGLSIVQRIVSDHAGALSIQSAPGVGTTVSIVLPRAGVNHEAAHFDS